MASGPKLFTVGPAYAQLCPHSTAHCPRHPSHIDTTRGWMQPQGSSHSAKPTTLFLDCSMTVPFLPLGLGSSHACLETSLMDRLVYRTLSKLPPSQTSPRFSQSTSVPACFVYLICFSSVSPEYSPGRIRAWSLFCILKPKVGKAVAPRKKCPSAGPRTRGMGLWEIDKDLWKSPSWIGGKLLNPRTGVLLSTGEGV